VTRTAQVAVFSGIRGPARAFTYALPDGLDVAPGHLVRVGFGPRSVAGVVTALDVPYEGTLRAVDGLVHPLPLLRPHQLALAEWMADQYRCGLADAVRAMLPPALAARARSALPTARGERREPVFALTPAGHAALDAPTGARIGARQLATLRALALGARSGAELADAGGSAVAARALAARDLVTEGARSVRRVPREFQLGEEDAVRDAEATAGQFAALEAILARLGQGDPFLLHGVTASGKTEVYLRAAAEALRRGLGVIVLVPEIALTAQVVARFVARFGDRVALLHSALSAGERYDEWRRVLDGVADVVVGSRSALFAPLERPGLIVADEEQEPSYKQESIPRYHAVESALALGRITGSVVILGSATPRVTTYHAATTGAMRLLTLSERVLDLTMPPTTVVDLRLELRSGNRGTLSRALQVALRTAVDKGEQAILYLNRRGFATIVLCRDCGFVVNCPACEIPFAYHLDGSLVCHRCGRRAERPAQCPNCASKRIRDLGVGTQRVEEDVRAVVPRAAIVRLDRDAVRTKGAHAVLFEKMRSGKAQVIVGTQMVAKGFDLPGVSLVGVVNADTVLNLPDFTSAERTFQLLAQVLGRSGRGPAGGRGIVQTYLPDHYAIRAAAAHDYTAFARAELEGRKRFGYPPFGRLVLLQTQAKRLDTVTKRAESYARELRAAAAGDAEVFGPAPAFAAKRAGAFRMQLILRGAAPLAVLGRAPLGGEWTVDVDPVTLLG
jgi:primosomal protein N' (replication factor Y) (superfamily II helicase)